MKPKPRNLSLSRGAAKNKKPKEHQRPNEKHIEYRSYHLSFPHGIHIGERNLDEGLSAFRADTLFSALYMEALKISEQKADRFLQMTKEGSLLLSDAFPYIGDTEYLPRPMCDVEIQDSRGDSVMKKALKSLAYVPADRLEDYLKGKLDALAEKKKLSELGEHHVKVSAAVAGEEETRPYHVGSYHFSQKKEAYVRKGLYVIIRSETSEADELFRELLQNLAFAGIGGKRSAGYGRFQIESVRELDSSKFEGTGRLYMSLCTSLPAEDELESACRGAAFQLIRRGGFIASDTYAPEPRRKKNLYTMGSGSCFKERFSGDIYDVGEGGRHPVYRYAKPLFWILRR